jgi:hypothetical protein
MEETARPIPVAQHSKKNPFGKKTLAIAITSKKEGFHEARWIRGLTNCRNQNFDGPHPNRHIFDQFLPVLLQP